MSAPEDGLFLVGIVLVVGLITWAVVGGLGPWLHLQRGAGAPSVCGQHAGV